MSLEQLLADYAAKGGKVRRVAKGARAMKRRDVSDATGDDNERAAYKARQTKALMALDRR